MCISGRVAPRVFVIGASKCGSTTMYQDLIGADTSALATANKVAGEIPDSPSPIRSRRAFRRHPCKDTDGALRHKLNAQSPSRFAPRGPRPPISARLIPSPAPVRALSITASPSRPSTPRSSPSSIRSASTQVAPAQPPARSSQSPAGAEPAFHEDGKAEPSLRSERESHIRRPYSAGMPYYLRHFPQCGCVASRDALNATCAGGPPKPGGDDCCSVRPRVHCLPLKRSPPLPPPRPGRMHRRLETHNHAPGEHPPLPKHDMSFMKCFLPPARKQKNPTAPAPPSQPSASATAIRPTASTSGPSRTSAASPRPWPRTAPQPTSPGHRPPSGSSGPTALQQRSSGRAAMPAPSLAPAAPVRRAAHHQPRAAGSSLIIQFHPVG